MWRNAASWFQLKEEKEKEAEKKQITKEIQEKKLKIKQIKKQRQESKDVKFKRLTNNMKARVTKVNIDGLEKTKDYVVTDRIKPLFNVESFQDIIDITKGVQKELKELGCFKHVNIYVDTLESEDEDDQLYEVNIKVREAGMSYLNVGLANCKEENEIGMIVRTGVCNLTGRADRIQLELTRGVNSTKETAISIVRPIKGLQTGSKFYLSISDTQFNFPHRIPIFQGVKCLGVGSDVKNGSVSLSCRLGLDLVHSLVNWSRLTTVQGTHRWTPVIESAGSQLIPSLKSSFTLNMLDSQLLPSHGLKFYLSHLLAMVPWTSEINFHQIRSGISAYYPFGKYFSSGFSAILSHTFKSSQQNTQVPLHMISDGRASLISRGGPPPSSNYTGDLTSAFYKLSLTSKLPFLQPNSMLCKLARFQTYFTGQYFREQGGSSNRHVSGFSHYFGVGIVGTISDLGRFELNYTIPLKQGLSKAGLSFGFGTEFL